MAMAMYLRKLLLESEGRTVTRTWVNGDFELANIQYTMDVPIVNQDSLYILAFVQDQGQASKQVRQAVIVKSGRKKGTTVVGIPEEPVNSELKDLSIYPNPGLALS